MPQLTHAEVEAARNLLYHYGQPQGWEPGSFHSALIRAMEAADPNNRERLLTAFPHFRWAINVLSIEGSGKLAEVITDLENTK